MKMILIQCVPQKGFGILWINCETKIYYLPNLCPPIPDFTIIITITIAKKMLFLGLKQKHILRLINEKIYEKLLLLTKYNV